MRKYIYILIGGALGAAFRLVVENIHIWNYHGNISTNTVIINTVGCFTLALFLTVNYEVFEINPDIRLGVATGLIGAFTTFSTFCKETVELMVGGKYFLAASYIVVSSILGFAAIYLGTVLARKVITVLVRNAKKNDMEITGNDEENQ